MTNRVHLLSPNQFPITIQLIGEHTRRVHELIHIERPAGLAALKVPNMEHHGEPIVTVVSAAVGPPVVVSPDGMVGTVETTPIYEDLIEEMRNAMRR